MADTTHIPQPTGDSRELIAYCLFIEYLASLEPDDLAEFQDLEKYLEAYNKCLAATRA